MCVWKNRVKSVSVILVWLYRSLWAQSQDNPEISLFLHLSGFWGSTVLHPHVSHYWDWEGRVLSSGRTELCRCNLDDSTDWYSWWDLGLQSRISLSPWDKLGVYNCLTHLLLIPLEHISLYLSTEHSISGCRFLGNMKHANKDFEMYLILYNCVFTSLDNTEAVLKQDVLTLTSSTSVVFVKTFIYFL